MRADIKGHIMVLRQLAQDDAVALRVDVDDPAIPRVAQDVEVQAGQAGRGGELAERADSTLLPIGGAGT